MAAAPLVGQLGRHVGQQREPRLEIGLDALLQPRHLGLAALQVGVHLDDGLGRLGVLLEAREDGRVGGADRRGVALQLVDHEAWSGKLGNRIPATQTRGALTTTMVTVQTNRGQERKFLWTLQQQRRPPDQGCWLVHECLYVENAIEQTL